MTLSVGPTQIFGTPIPSDDPHAVSVEYSNWQDLRKLLADEEEICSRVRYGYPRFTINPLILELEGKFLANKPPGTGCLLFPSPQVAARCRQFMERWSDAREFSFETLNTRLPPQFEGTAITAIYFKDEFIKTARQFWAIFGEGISSRQAEYFLHFGFEIDQNSTYQPINPQLGKVSKTNIAHRVADLTGVNHEDVYLFPTGMSAVFHSHLVFERLTLAVKQEFCAVLYGFAFKDTPKLLSKWGTGLKWYPKGTEEELDQLEEYLQDHRISGLLCEVPANPSLRTPNLERIKALASKYNFLVAIDDTLGNMVNVNVLDYCDISITSLTKIFNGACNAMAGSIQISPLSSNKDLVKPCLDELYEDNFWSQDAVVIDKNSENVLERIEISEKNTQELLDLLNRSPHVKTIYYPSMNDTQPNYDLYKTEKGGYGSLFCIVFKKDEDAAKFYDALNVFKGPSLGVNSTLCFPYALGAHKDDLEVPERAGISKYIIRISTGLEPIEQLKKVFSDALNALA